MVAYNSNPSTLKPEAGEVRVPTWLHSQMKEERGKENKKRRGKNGE